MGAVLLRPALFQPGVGTVAVAQGAVMSFAGTGVMFTVVFAVPAALLGEGVVAFHADLSFGILF